MARTDWMSGRWGIMVHWIAPGPPPEHGPYRTDLNDAVDNFDLPRFLNDFAATGADWLIFTVGQNTGYYVSPSQLLDEWVGPGHCSQRDLVQEIMDKIIPVYRPSNKRFIPQQQTETLDNFIADRLKQISVTRILTQVGVKVSHLRTISSAGIETILDLKQHGIPEEIPSPVRDRIQAWIKEHEEEAMEQFPFDQSGQYKRFIAYLPGEVAENPTLQRAFLWNTEARTNQRTFQKRYTEFVKEWSQRWGLQCNGWLFDGCQSREVFHSRNRDWNLWNDAARAGNSQSAVAFNNGSFAAGKTGPAAKDRSFYIGGEQDFLAGEVEVLHKGRIRLGNGIIPRYHLPRSRFAAGTACQWHALVPIDCVWVHGNAPTGAFTKRFAPIPETPTPPMEKPVYSDDELVQFMNTCLSVGGAVTLNVGIYQEGHLGPETVAQLQRIAPRLYR